MGNEAGPGVGFEFPSFKVTWMKRDLLLFANSIGATYPDELHYLYVRHLRHPRTKIASATAILGNVG